MSQCFLVVGYPRTGKTTWTKEAVARIGVRPLVFDPSGQWGQDAPHLDVFMGRVERTRWGVFVFEEATAFFSNRGCSDRIVHLLVRRRHPAPGRTFFFQFHSLRSIPADIMDYTDRLVLFKTADRPALVEQKFKGWDQLIDGYRRVQRMSGAHARVEVPIFG